MRALACLVVLTACSGSPPRAVPIAHVVVEEPAEVAPVPEGIAVPQLAPAPIDANPWHGYACHLAAAWSATFPLDPRAAPPDASAVDLTGWYAEGRIARWFSWRAHGVSMGELRWLRREGDQWEESGSGAQRWPHALAPSDAYTVVATTPHFALVAHRGGVDNRFLAALWIVRDSGPPVRVDFRGMSLIAGVLVTDAGEVHLHLDGFQNQLVLRFAADGTETGRRPVALRSDAAPLGAAVDADHAGLIEELEGEARLDPYDGSAPSLLSLVPVFDPNHQLESVGACRGGEDLRFGTFTHGHGFAATDDMLVTYQVRGTELCVRAVRVPMFEPPRPWDCERCDAFLRATDEGALVGSVLYDDGRTRDIRCEAGPPQDFPLDRAQVDDP